MQRDNNLDAFRMLSMLMIIGLHFFNYSGCLETYYTPTQMNYWPTWIGEAVSYLGVNSFVLITGYFMINSSNYSAH